MKIKFPTDSDEKFDPQACPNGTMWRVTIAHIRDSRQLIIKIRDDLFVRIGENPPKSGFRSFDTYFQWNTRWTNPVKFETGDRVVLIA